MGNPFVRPAVEFGVNAAREMAGGMRDAANTLADGAVEVSKAVVGAVDRLTDTVRDLGERAIHAVWALGDTALKAAALALSLGLLLWFLGFFTFIQPLLFGAAQPAPKGLSWPEPPAIASPSVSNFGQVAVLELGRSMGMIAVGRDDTDGSSNSLALAPPQQLQAPVSPGMVQAYQHTVDTVQAYQHTVDTVMKLDQRERNDALQWEAREREWRANVYKMQLAATIEELSQERAGVQAFHRRMTFVVLTIVLAIILAALCLIHPMQFLEVLGHLLAFMRHDCPALVGAFIHQVGPALGFFAHQVWPALVGDFIHVPSFRYGVIVLMVAVFWRIFLC